MSGTESEGAGIYHEGTVMTVEDCSIADNTATAGSGGGISSYGLITVTMSTLSGNEAARGGGIYAGYGSQFDLVNSTVTGNHSAGPGANGGGIYTDYSSAVSIALCTIANNDTQGDGAHGQG